MKVSLLRFSILSALFAFILAGSIDAAPNAKPTPFVPHHTVIGSITATSITVNTYSGYKTYKIDKYTTITLLGKTVTFNELKPGMKVSVAGGTDPTIAASITASNPPKDPTTPAPAKGR